LADQRKIKQIVINLLSNAVKFTPSGGRVDVRWQVIENRCCELTVSDNGIGIAPDDLTRVLQPFAQAESGLNRRYEGTGLGLPLTRGLVELHGGSLRLESDLGQGTRAILEFPLARAHVIGAQPAAVDGLAASHWPIRQTIEALEQTIRTGFLSGEDNVTG
ncbi:MAG TPA: ATP-binding protein, partial [Stellaceae bacterium]